MSPPSRATLCFFLSVPKTCFCFDVFTGGLGDPGSKTCDYDREEDEEEEEIWTPKESQWRGRCVSTSTRTIRSSSGSNQIRSDLIKVVGLEPGLVVGRCQPGKSEFGPLPGPDDIDVDVDIGKGIEGKGREGPTRQTNPPG